MRRDITSLSVEGREPGFGDLKVSKRIYTSLNDFIVYEIRYEGDLGSVQLQLVDHEVEALVVKQDTIKP